MTRIGKRNTQFEKTITLFNRDTHLCSFRFFGRATAQEGLHKHQVIITRRGHAWDVNALQMDDKPDADGNVHWSRVDRLSGKNVDIKNLLLDIEKFLGSEILDTWRSFRFMGYVIPEEFKDGKDWSSGHLAAFGKD